jgi:bifunctional non-homologous end joining protein LigD
MRPPQLKPMLATPGPLPTSTRDFALEVKWDGMRVLARLDGAGGLRLLSRNGNQATARYPELAELAALLPGREAVLDGEVIATDEAGRPSFGALQERMPLHRPTEIAAAVRRRPVTLMLFDVLWLDGRSLLAQPYQQRRAALESLPAAGRRVVVPPAWSGAAAAQALAWTRAEGLEGVIAKRLGSHYRPGARSRDWIKIKHVRSIEVVVGGWVARDPGGRTLKSLLLGLPGPAGLAYVGAVGTGFAEAERQRLAALLHGLATTDSPFTGPVDDIDRGQPPRFVRPELTAEVDYAGFGSAGSLRQPVWKGLRGEQHE